MSIKENKALIRRMYDEINKGNFHAFYNLCAPDYVQHMTDRDLSLEEAKESELKAFDNNTNISATPIMIIAEGDKIAVLVTWRMTDKQTGKKIEMTNANILRLENSKCKELWHVTDIRLAQQLGFIPK